MTTKPQSDAEAEDVAANICSLFSIMNDPKYGPKIAGDAQKVLELVVGYAQSRTKPLVDALDKAIGALGYAQTVLPINQLQGIPNVLEEAKRAVALAQEKVRQS